MAVVENILIIVENLPVPFDRRVWMEATTLQKAGYEVSVICPMGKGYDAEHEIIEDIHIYRHPMSTEDGGSALNYLKEYGIAVSWEFRLAHRVWQERGFDVVHICNPPDLLFLTAGWFKLLKGVPVIFDHHDLSPEMYIAKYGRRDIFYYGLKVAEWLTYAIANRVISTNESHRNVALTRGRKKPEHVSIVRSAPDLTRFKPTGPNPRYRNNRQYLVGYMGVIGEPEGVDYLLRMIKFLVTEKDRQDIHFMVIGDGPALESLQVLAKDLEITDYVEFTGFQTGAVLLERLSSCDLCVEPSPTSDYNENCTMNKILEYMALGKPIVQFDLREGRRSAENASLYATPNDETEFAERILELLADAELRERIGNEGHRRMVDFLGWQHQAPKLLETYAQLLPNTAGHDQSIAQQEKQKIVS